MPVVAPPAACGPVRACGAAVSDEPLSRPPARDTGWLGKPAGVLTPEIVRAALDVLWNPPPREPSPYDRMVMTSALERIPVMRPPSTPCCASGAMRLTGRGGLRASRNGFGPDLHGGWVNAPWCAVRDQTATCCRKGNSQFAASQDLRPWSPGPTGNSGTPAVLHPSRLHKGG